MVSIGATYVLYVDLFNFIHRIVLHLDPRLYTARHNI